MATEESTKGISAGAAILITIAFVSVGLVLYNIVMPMFNNGVRKAGNISQNVSNSSYVQYDGTTVQGSQVIGAINTEASQDTTVKVKTLAHTAGTDYTSSSYNITVKSNQDYIEPTAEFISVLVKNSNNTVTGITFTQQ